MLGGLPSFQPTSPLGPEDVAITGGGAIYTALPPTQGGIDSADPASGGSCGAGDRGRAEPLGSPWALERRHDADGTGVESDPFGIVAVGKTRYVADAGANDLVRERAGTASLVTVFPRIHHRADSVPTAVRRGLDGALYVGELGGGAAPRARPRLAGRSGPPTHGLRARLHEHHRHRLRPQGGPLRGGAHAELRQGHPRRTSRFSDQLMAFALPN